MAKKMIVTEIITWRRIRQFWSWLQRRPSSCTWLIMVIMIIMVVMVIMVIMVGVSINTAAEGWQCRIITWLMVELIMIPPPEKLEITNRSEEI